MTQTAEQLLQEIEPDLREILYDITVFFVKTDWYSSTDYCQYCNKLYGNYRLAADKSHMPDCNVLRAEKILKILDDYED